MKKSPDSIKSTLNAIFAPKTLMWLFPFLLIIPNAVFFFTEPTALLSRITDVLLPLGLYMLVMSCSRNVGRTALFCTFFSLFAAFQIVLLYLYGESIIAVDMYVNLVTTNPSEAGELLSNLAMAIALIVILYFPPIVWGVMLIIKRRKATAASLRMPRLTGCILTGAGLIGLILCYALVPGFKIKREVFPANVLHNMYTAVVRTYDAQHYSVTSADFSYHAATTRPIEKKEIYVLVIGETSRADNWQLMGYGRPTNPKLMERRADLALFDKALSESNTTHKAVPLLLTHLTAETFGDSICFTKSIISAFNSAGFNTAYFSNQHRNHSFIDFFANEAQKHEFIRDYQKGDTPPYDIDLVTYLRDYIGTAPSNKIFVVLHSYGSHFNYKERYPQKYAVFTPDNSSQADKTNRGQLVNAYDNTIVFTDAMLDDIITALEAENCSAAMVYLSDHGEDIFDDERGRFLHSSPVPTYNQIHVPLIVWTSETFREENPQITAALKKNAGKDVSTARSVFHTLIQIGGIGTPYFKPQASLGDSLYVMKPRRYLNDYNEGVDYGHAGFREPDFHRLDSADIRFWSR